ncbi:MAG: ArgE/DapE family deacylase [Gemmatimonadaceae bacterium]|nr:ArgE/DapE family deacylase [Gemmatimonadaceae bacterium]
MPVRPGDARALLETLVRVDSRNPDLVPGAPGEANCAHVLAEVLGGWGFRLQWQDAAPGRPNLVARIGAARPGAPTLLFNGHLDVVGTDGMTHAPFAPHVADGRLYARGACDMKAGIAAMCVAAHRAAGDGLPGEVIVAAVCDEEYASIGTRALLAAGVRADAAVVTEPTRLAICPAHKGFAWLEFTVHGVAAHGSRHDIGVDAIAHAAQLAVAWTTHGRDVLRSVTHPLLGHASVHASTITGGSGWSTYPDRCVLRVERRTVPGEDAQTVHDEATRIVAALQAALPALRVEWTVPLVQAPSDVATDAPIVRALQRATAAHAGEAAPIEGLGCWTDAALLNAAGIPAVCYGPGDIALAHAATEWVPLAEVEAAAAVLEGLARAWCA